MPRSCDEQAPAPECRPGTPRKRPRGPTQERVDARERERERKRQRKAQLRAKCRRAKERFATDEELNSI